jgi:predicted XRE-type DNA-binding protein
MAAKKLKKNPHIGERLDEYLAEEGLLEEVISLASKQMLARQLQAKMKSKRLTVAKMAHAMGTTRMQVHRILDPRNHNVTLATLKRAAAAIGSKLRLELV